MSKVKVRKLFADREPVNVFTFNGNPDNARVDPTFAEDSQIENMLMKFARGEVHTRQPFYADVSDFSDYRTLNERVMRLQKEFAKLPSEVRALTGNDPTRLSEVVNNPQYKELLENVGFFEQVSQGRLGGSEGTPSAGSGVQPQDAPKGANKEAPKGDS